MLFVIVLMVIPGCLNEENDIAQDVNEADTDISTLESINGTDSSNITDSECSGQNCTLLKKGESLKRVACAAPETPYGKLRLINASELNDSLSPMRNECSIVIFYSPYCIFSARAAPALNGIARYYPNISVVAVDITESNSINMKYGIVAIPTVLLVHNIRPIAKLNHTNATLESLRDFIVRYTGLKANIDDANLTHIEFDFVGPLPSKIVDKPDWLLLISWCFLLITGVYYFCRSTLATKVYVWFVTTWREAEQAERPHND